MSGSREASSAPPRSGRSSHTQPVMPMCRSSARHCRSSSGLPVKQCTTAGMPRGAWRLDRVDGEGRNGRIGLNLEVTVTSQKLLQLPPPVGITFTQHTIVLGNMDA